MKRFLKTISDLLLANSPPDRGQQAPEGDQHLTWTPTHRHKKGNLYRVIAEGICEANRSPVMIYEDAEGTIWVRAAQEFYDGRFEEV